MKEKNKLNITEHFNTYNNTTTITRNHTKHKQNLYHYLSLQIRLLELNASASHLEFLLL